MSDEDPFDNYFKSFTEGVEPGRRVMPLFRYRQGSDLKNWSSAGGTKYLPGEWYLQAGCKNWQGAAAASGMVELTLPIAFADCPIIVCQVTNTNPGFERCVMQPTFAAPFLLECYWWADNNLTRVDFFWIAIGPLGL